MHREWMRIALAEAASAAANGEVPVGAVLVGPEGEIARGRNACIGSHDPTAHAEIRVLRAAGRKLGNYRMPGTTLYVTVEPCTMCAGALVHARIGTLVFGVREPKGGAVLSRPGAGDGQPLDGLNHRFDVIEGVMAEACAARITEFFAAKRAGG